ncbi:MAG: hypothetical protein LBP61_03435, partial [Desulfovibrio sp.]|nr:hypothetical protein [Desulfovibrio sp.]
MFPVSWRFFSLRSFLSLPGAKAGNPARLTLPGRLRLQPLPVLALLAAFLIQAAPVLGATPQPALNAAVSGTGAVPGNISFGSFDAAHIYAASSGKNLYGATSIALPTRIGDLSALLLGQVDAQKNAGTGALVNLVRTQVNAFGLPGGLTTITGNGATRTHSAGAPNAFEEIRWLTINSGANGASLTNLHFTDVKVENTYNDATGSGGVVNGLIGSAYNVGNVSTDSIAMGDLTDNEFSAISVSLHGYRDDQYLAGGGVLGLRSTTNSARMGNIVGNIFRNVTVTTDESSSSSASSHKGSAYIEGGGIIGVDAVSSPGTKSGSAFIESLVNNLFTDVHVDSGDIILGGGLVGVNNNSQNRDALTYAQLLDASGNIFGNGEDNNITVRAGYSLRGGGVIGVNGLSDAQVHLDGLTDNIFAGITVETGSYLRGGGIVGLNSNDGGDAKFGTITPTAVDSILENAIGNVFLNLRVNAGTLAPGNGGSLDGGGILGARSNMGMATVSGVVGNIFKGLRVSASTSLSSPAPAYNGHLDGGGIVGASSVDKASLLGVSGNYFDDLHVTVAQNLTGGGILGASAANVVTVISSTAPTHWAVITD